MVMQICITLDIFSDTAKAQICTYSKLFDFYDIYIWHITIAILAQNKLTFEVKPYFGQKSA